ncbi:MAG: diguanylate cyclase [Myxococcales bacterium]|nr:diguanylate cyclase [Myxococcales bacterium]
MAYLASMQDGSDSPPEPDEVSTAQLQRAPRVLSGAREHGALHVLSGPHNGAIFMLDQPVITIGRGSGCQVYLVDQGISREHARVVRHEDGFYLEDAGSRNGTQCQGELIRGRRKLYDGDRISLGAQTVMRFSLQDRIERAASLQTVELMIRDPLTQLVNRRQVDDRLRSEFAYARRHRSPLHCMMVDIDHFKEVNDTYGHQVGDAVLREVARLLEHAVRVEDMVGRYGGEEFAICIRGIDKLGAFALAERLRRAIEELELQHHDQRVRVTTSVGVASLRPSHKDVEALVADADAALYEAKQAGRNRVIAH